MSELSIPYFDTELYSRVLIKPQQINNDIYINLKNNLKNKVEKKCNKYGYVTKIYKIIDFSEGEVVPENYDSSIVYKVKYSCRICLPVVDTNIICKVDLLNKSLVKCSNGPIVCIIGINYINNNNFHINNKGEIIYTKSNQVIKNSDYILVNIRGTNFFADDERIVILGSLEDTANDDDINTYYKENLEGESGENVLDDLNDGLSDTSDYENSDLESDEIKNNNYINL